MVDWLAGNRIRGTSTERTSTTGFNTVAGGWKELGRHSGTAPSVTNLDNKRYLMILGHGIRGSGGSGSAAMRFNNDSGGNNTSGNYSKRTSEGGNTDYTQIDQSQMQAVVEHSDVTGNHSFNVQYVANLATKEKLMIGHGVHSSQLGDDYPPGGHEGTYKWDNTTDAINRVDFFNGAGGDTWNTSSECVVLGWDPDDTHTTNFWEELGTASGGSPSLEFSFTAKKYLWGQYFVQGDSGTYQAGLRLGSTTIDTDPNYAERQSNNGGGYSPYGSQTRAPANSPLGTTALPVYGNFFIINTSANEKLIINHTVTGNTAGVGNAPQRAESVSKWDNTSNQADIINIHKIAGTATNTTSNSILKVWGSN